MDMLFTMKVQILVHDYDSYSPQVVDVLMDGATVKAGVELGVEDEWVTLAGEDDFRYGSDVDTFFAPSAPHTPCFVHLFHV